VVEEGKGKNEIDIEYRRVDEKKGESEVRRDPGV
jgi:hypothetical protein